MQLCSEKIVNAALLITAKLRGGWLTLRNRWTFSVVQVEENKLLWRQQIWYAITHNGTEKYLCHILKGSQEYSKNKNKNPHWWFLYPCECAYMHDHKRIH